MQRVFEVMEKVAQTDATVLITGETGTGKELVARADPLRRRAQGARASWRRTAARCPTRCSRASCSATSAARSPARTHDKKGLFEVADGGTIFLDEIGETEPGMQVRLLRVLQDGEIRPLGSSETRQGRRARHRGHQPRPAASRSQEGRFREDLYYRLRVVEIELPPLRERREDIPLLAHHFLDKPNAQHGARALRLHERRDGPARRARVARQRARARERDERAVALAAADAESVSVEMLSEHVRGGAATTSASSVSLPARARPQPRRGRAEARDDRQALADTGSKTKAAERLGIPRQSLQKMMKRLALGDLPTDDDQD